MGILYVPDPRKLRNLVSFLFVNLPCSPALLVRFVRPAMLHLDHRYTQSLTIRTLSNGDTDVITAPSNHSNST